MGWNYPEISLEEMVKLIKGFVDILILASGYQSSGLPAHWDAQNIKKALQWGLFFENAFSHLSSSDVYMDSLKELDACLTEITSDPSFPQGLSCLSSTTLSKGRAFVSEHLIRALPLRDAHLWAFLRATIETDLTELREREHDFLNMYLNKLTLLDSSLDFVQQPTRDLITSSSDITQNMETDKSNGENFTKFAVDGLLKRQSAVSCISTVQRSLDILCSAIKCDSWINSDNSLMQEHLQQDSFSALMGSVDDMVDFVTWSHWKSRNLVYFLDMGTVRLVSGVSMIFSAPKFQRTQVFERLHISAEGRDDKLAEIIELLLLGCVASRWSNLIEHFMSISYNSLTISKQYHELCERVTHNFYSKEEMMNSKESCILEYLTGMLSGQLHQLWKLSPALLAASIPSWSPLFRLYFSEIETQFKGNSSTRCCSCSQDGKEHKNCELAERIWCLHIFHVCGSLLMLGGAIG
ncbi:Fanconi anemia group F protein (FANCF) [Melia azedarach]|uniref:Fanconi anemia group F protein (FANCF) n=2 Tax=Melia azedarach TaxID=155640 RepID=A0ACC1YYR8_MELAZ|nr:Fanconi anemia group F protein (FANCF) [Melia azedarach]KAJ4728315.1 Fanconi anemia group F protein (FANCF) [Melia azedarach]